MDSSGRVVNAIFAKDDPQGCESISLETSGCLLRVLVDGEFFGPPNPVFAPENFTRPVVGADHWGHIDPDGDDFDISTDHAPGDFTRYRSQGVTAKLTWNFDAFQFTSVSHYMHFDMRETLDVDGGPVAQSIVMRDVDAQNFAQELRLNGELERARWVAGIYYLWMDTDDHNGFAASEGGPLTTTLYPFVLSGPLGVPATDLLPGGAVGLPPLEANSSQCCAIRRCGGNLKLEGRIPKRLSIATSSLPMPASMGSGPWRPQDSIFAAAI